MSNDTAVAEKRVDEGGIGKETPRDDLPVRRAPWARRRLVVVIVLVVAAAVGLGVASTGGSAKGPSSNVHASAGGPVSAHSNVANSAPSGASPAGAAAAGAGAAGVQSGAQSASPAAGGLPDEVPQLPTRVIKTGSIGLSVPAGAGRIDATLGRVSAKADGLGGFVSSSSVQTAGGGPTAAGALTLRVPVAAFDTLVAFVQTLGSPTSVTTSGQDVTASYVDLQARIAALQGARTQFEQILARAVTIGDILSVESQISDIETQVEQLQGQLQVLSDQTSFSTLTVDVTQTAVTGVVHPARPAGGLEKAWLHARRSFAHGVEAVVGASGGIAVFLVFAGLLALAGRLIWKRALRV
jgi:hypothetical protein